MGAFFKPSISLYCFAAMLTTLNPGFAGKTAYASNAAWDVNHPPGPAYHASIDTRTGTWVSVDISPDGKTLIFDLLGDIYRMPITGGNATAISSGIAWDMQPRFSPDGKRIAYTSDAGGGDNIWLMDIDGSNKQPLTQENYRLLNNPVWSPDGRFIAARKHFTSTRSIGAGEIWLYHLTGGTGVPLNKRPNEEKDLGEPAFSPDGRYVYFSRDSTSGDSFEYNKDSNGQIYKIFAIDRHTGDIQTVVSGQGGAVRPTPSPDGKYLAFVRRIRNQSALFLKDLETDAIFPIYLELDRDMQETWAIHSVYPGMAWTPDSRELIFWAKGKLHRVDIKTRKSHEIPFHIKDQREMRETVRSTRPAYTEHFNTHMLRWAQVSPDGKQIVFQSLGHLYIKDLPNGTSKRLTQQKDHFEFYPSYSRDGRWIVYTTWNDQTLGQLRKVHSKGGTNHVLTDKPGHYAEPQFSPDGQHIVFRKLEGSALVSSKYTSKPGIYRVSANGGPAIKILDEGSEPFFTHSSSRFFLTRTQRNDSRITTKLISVNLDGKEEQQHIDVDFASEFKISPDEKWLVYTKQYRTYIAPFTRASMPISLEPESKNLPLVQLSDTGSTYLHWSADSHRLYWSQGPTLFSQMIKQDSATHALAISKPETLALGFSHKADKPDGDLALTGARLITMKGDEVIENGTLIIKQNRIAAIGKANEIRIPSDIKRMDLNGKTIIPGLIDVHWHGAHAASEITPQQNWEYYATLAFGVTTLHDPSADTSTVFASSELQKAGLISAPRIFSTGTILYGARHFYTAEINNYSDAQAHIARMQAVGAFSVKSYNQPRRDQRQQILAAAREANILVVPEGGSLFMQDMTLIIDGHTSIEHSIPMAAIYDDVKQLWSQSKTAYTPTLGVAFGGLGGEYYWYHHHDVWKHPLLSRYVPHSSLWPRAIRRQMAPDADYNHFNNARIVKELSDLNVRVQIGAHGQREGLAAHWELWMFAQGGMHPHDVLRSGTLHGAKLLGMDADLGSLEPGKLADLLVLNTNPLESIYATDNISLVMVNGRLYDVQTMDQIGLHPKKRKPFFFEELQTLYNTLH